MLEVVRDVWTYVMQMLPLGLLALVILLLLRPVRTKRLRKLGLTSSIWREIALALFVVFCAGLTALTLFPANLWAYVFDGMFRQTYWRWAWSGRSLADFYPTWEQTMSQIPYLSEMLTPFQEIQRALRHMSYWLLFMLLGNIVMFMPIGFFPALLWRRWKWWKSLITGFFTSTVIEFVQFFIGRSTDIDDVILNSLGALAGFWIFWLLRSIFPNFIRNFQCQPSGGDYCG